MRGRRWIGLLAAVLLVACGGSSGSPTAKLGALNTKVEVAFWHALSGTLETQLKAVTEQFNGSQSNVHVTLVNKGGYTDLGRAILTALAANQPPDLTQCIETDAAKYYSSKAIADLTPYINAADGLSAADLNDIFPVMLNAAKIKGTYYQFPFNKSTIVMYYNQDMFAAKGIANPPATWDEFFADAAKLADPSKGVTGVEGPTIDTFYSMLYEYGGQLYDDPNKPTKSLVNSAAGIKAMTLWASAIKSGYAKPLPAGSFQDQVTFQNQKSAMYVASQVSYQFLKTPIGNKFKFAEAPFPAGDKGVKDEMYGANLCVFNKSAMDVQHGAFLYMKYLTSESSSTIWAQKTSYMPVRQSAYTALLNGFYKDNPSQAVAPTMLSKGYLFALPVVPTSNQQRDALTTELNNIAAGRADPKTGLDRAAQQMTDIMATG
jgi:multiple sugar transport system substrate-binding protein